MGQSPGLGLNWSPKHGEGGFSRAVNHRLNVSPAAGILRWGGPSYGAHGQREAGDQHSGVRPLLLKSKKKFF